MKLAVVTDFDGTLMHQDVGDYLMEELGVTDLPEVRQMSRLVREKKIGSMEWIKVAYAKLDGQKQTVDQLLGQVHLRSGAESFLDFCQDRDIPVTILSDGMEYYVHSIVNQLQLNIQDIIVNPIRYREDGSYELGLQNANEACRWCGCCKSEAVRKIKSDDYRIIYIGDGSSDYFGSSFADWIFARGSLAHYLEQDGTPFYPFETFHDIMAVLAPEIESFEQGIADRKSDKAHPFCRFS
ncbi:MtnX-like HAD-IB family phosphatase [Paenibacillus thalictri]|uniref:2,3-diketo-5-methylthio-1-phosphopentane phosphatase n=1 Tax=Paenibacillus thalictri TaxID=2527873 RepID=A0A4Q9DNZ4_9BACL|nr:MtnX-like HAD-IB family phosphatase [Paenibacillus thalictri]TBL76293.1 2,3-diketo-5-methylthio-1-phosphopentane phosphatase [Paenibacillus thalictri]